MKASDEMLTVELDSCFQFWDDFIRKWLTGNLGTIVHLPKDTDLLHLPEPWWGWNGNGRLNSVVVNYHPGPGGPPQSKKTIEELFTNDFSYRELMGKGIKPKLSEKQKQIGVRQTTDGWHLNFRARKFADIIGVPVNDTSHHLSIELSPFHNDDYKKVWDFIKLNPEIVKRYILGFAAIAAKKGIDKDSPLHNKVFVRVCEANFEKYIEFLNLKNDEITPSFKLRNENPHYSVTSYTVLEWPETEFIVVKGNRNFFPEIDNNNLK